MLKTEMKKQKGITLIALIITILFSYDQKIKCSNSKVSSLQQFSKNKIFTYLENEFVKNTTSFF